MGAAIGYSNQTLKPAAFLLQFYYTLHISMMTILKTMDVLMFIYNFVSFDNYSIFTDQYQLIMFIIIIKDNFSLL